MHVFLNPEEGRLRAFWRMLLQLVLTVAVAALPVVGLGTSLSWLRRHGFLANVNDLVFDKIADLIVGPLFTVLMLASVGLAARYLDRRPVADLGFRLSRRWFGDAAYGFGVSGLMMTALFLVAFAAGWIRVTGVFRGTPGLPILLGFSYTVVKVVCVATYEEALSRGYQLRNLAEGLNGVRGLRPRSAVALSVLLTSSFFGLLHTMNEHATALSTVLIAVIGMLFALPYVLTGQLATSIGLHAGWNLFQGAVFGFPDSGDLEPVSVLATESSGAELLVGGAFGPEAGLLSLFAILLGAAVIVLRARTHGGLGVDTRIAQYAPSR